MDLSWFQNKRILITGHTGFKGAWLTRMLVNAGAIVTGYALEPPTTPNLFDLCDVKSRITHIEGDVRDLEAMKAAFDKAKPELVIHMAAQPLVRTSYEEPVYTYETNVMGTVHVCECVRTTPSVRSFLNVTTDKVYENRELGKAFCEDEPLDGYDPYSNSKSCSELVTHSYIRSFFNDMDVAVSTARAGNVIGGGDFAKDRIVPDCVRAAMAGKPIIVRNPHSVRPYQHVLEPLGAYLMILQAQYEDASKAGFYNVGPDDADCLTTGELADAFCAAWGDVSWENQYAGGPHEAGLLRLNCTKLKETFGWRPRWDAATAISKTVEWSRAYAAGEAVTGVMDSQIDEFFRVDKKS